MCSKTAHIYLFFCRSEQDHGAASAASAVNGTTTNVVDVAMINEEVKRLRRLLAGKVEVKKRKRTAKGTKKNYLRFQKTKLAIKKGGLHIYVIYENGNVSLGSAALSIPL